MTAGYSLTELIYCLLRLGQTSRAEAFLPATRSYLLNGDGDTRASYYVAEGMVRFYQGRLQAAKDALERQKKERREDSLVEFDSIIALGYLAEIARRQGILSHRQVSAFIKELDRLGHDWPLGVEAEPLRELYQECGRREWFADRFRPYLGTVHSREATPRPVLELKTLGCFSATLNGKEIHTTPKTRELLVYLALHGSRRADEVADAMWPHFSLEAARNNLKAQMRHLRMALEGALGQPGSDLVSWNKAQGTYSLAPMLEIRLDTQTLEVESQTPSYEVQLAALQRHQGDFLSGHDSDWVTEAQCRYRTMAVTLCLSLAVQAEEVDIAAAIGLYQQAMK